MPTWVCTCLTCPECVRVLSVHAVHLRTAAPCRLPVVLNKAVMLTFPQRAVVPSAPPSDTHVQRWRHRWRQRMESSRFEGLTWTSSCILCRALSEWESTVSIPDRSGPKKPSGKQMLLDPLLLFSILDCQNQNRPYCRARLGVHVEIQGYSHT